VSLSLRVWAEGGTSTIATSATMLKGANDASDRSCTPHTPHTPRRSEVGSEVGSEPGELAPIAQPAAAHPLASTEPVSTVGTLPAPTPWAATPADGSVLPGS
jgi:hypothetical protein